MSAPSYLITPNNPDSHQSSSNYVISIIPFANRDLFTNKGQIKNKIDAALKTREPFTIVNDATRITINNSKGSPTDSAEINLLSGDINYAAAISPGDHAMIWLINDPAIWDKISKDVAAKNPNVNGANSGLKFVGRVNSVRQQLQTDPATGKQMFRYMITMNGFSELQTQIYFNQMLDPNLPNSSVTAKGVDWFVEISEQYRALFKSIQNSGRLKTEEVLKFFLDVFTGPGPKDRAKKILGNSVRTPNASMLIPTQLAKYLGVTQKEEKSLSIKYADVLQRIFGIQQYSSNTTSSKQTDKVAASDLDSMFPSNTNKDGTSTEYICDALKGGTSLPAGNFNNVTLWSLLSTHSNPTINELYTTLKYIPNKGIMPTVTLRQIALTTDRMKSKLSPNTATYYTNVPRWKLDSKYPIMNYNLGTSDAERFNFFQVFTNSVNTNNPQETMQLQIAQGNMEIDDSDIYRSGPRIHSSMSDTDAGAERAGYKVENIKTWIALISDWFSNGHLKMNGSITIPGIQAPICIGDNFEFDNKLFHIEAISHSFEVAGDGKKTFMTTLALSHGYYIVNGKLEYTAGGMLHNKRAGMNDGLLPGISDSELHVDDKFIESSDNSTNDSAQNNTGDLFIRDNAQNTVDKIKSEFLKKFGVK